MQIVNRQGLLAVPGNQHAQGRHWGSAAQGGLEPGEGVCLYSGRDIGVQQKADGIA